MKVTCQSTQPDWRFTLLDDSTFSGTDYSFSLVHVFTNYSATTYELLKSSTEYFCLITEV